MHLDDPYECPKSGSIGHTHLAVPDFPSEFTALIFPIGRKDPFFLPGGHPYIHI